MTSVNYKLVATNSNFFPHDERCLQLAQKEIDAKSFFISADFHIDGDHSWCEGRVAYKKISQENIPSEKFTVNYYLMLKSTQVSNKIFKICEHSELKKESENPLIALTYKILNRKEDSLEPSDLHEIAKTFALYGFDEIAFEYFQKAALEGCNDVCFSLAAIYSKGIGVEKDLSLALSWLKKSALAGNLDAQYQLFKCYSNGSEGIEVNIELAILYLIKAGEGGHLQAQLDLADCYYYGEGIAQDKEKAFEWVKKSAEGGYLQAKFGLYEWYKAGIGTKINDEEAIKWCIKAAEGGHRDAQFKLGEYYLDISKPPIIDKGIQWLLKSTLSPSGCELMTKNPLNLRKIRSSFDKTESISGIVRLGICYEEGFGVPQDNDLALLLYSEASSRKSFQGDYRIGICYENGVGVKQSYKKALYYFEKADTEKAREAGFYFAAIELANLYENGYGVETNLKKAFELYKVAADCGSSLALTNLAGFYMKGKGVPKNESTSVQLYKEAIAKDKDAFQACLELGIYYLTFKDYANKREAFKLFLKVAIQDCASGQLWLSQCYTLGYGVKKNLVRAKEYAKLAADKGHPKAIYLLGTLFYEEKTRSSIIEGMKYFEEAAKAEYPPAYSILARICKENKDLVKSKEWSKKAGNAPEIFSWVDPYDLGSIRLLFTEEKPSWVEDLRFWLNAVITLKKEKGCSVNKLDPSEVEALAKELQKLELTLQNELKEKNLIIQKKVEIAKLAQEEKEHLELLSKEFKIDLTVPPKMTKPKTLAKKRSKFKGKGKKQVKKSNASNKQEAAQTQVSHIENIPFQKEEVSCEPLPIQSLSLALSKKTSFFYVLPRVRERWLSKDPAILRQITDFKDGLVIKPYEALSDKEILEMRAFHLVEVENILSNPQAKKIFSFSVDNGHKMLAKIKFDGQEEEIKGVISFGIDPKENQNEKDVIYHRFFNSYEADISSDLFDEVEKNSEIEKVDEVINPQIDGSWETVSKTTFDICKEGLKVTFSDENYNLTILPVDQKAWYRLLGIACT